MTIDAPSSYYPGCDLVGDPITATFSWGDGTTSAGNIVPGLGTRFTIRGTHSYAKPGYFKIVITQTNNRTGVSREDRHYNPRVNAAVLKRSQPLKWTVGRRYAERLVQVPAPLGPGAKYRAMIAWGDGSRSKARIAVKASRLSIFGRHVWGDAVRGGRIAVDLIALESGARVRIIRPLEVGSGATGG